MAANCSEQQLPIDAVKIALDVDIEHPVEPPAPLSVLLPHGGASTTDLLVQNGRDPIARYKLGQIEAEGVISFPQMGVWERREPPLTKFPDANSAMRAAGDRPNKSA
jgi:hypothetical protein